MIFHIPFEVVKQRRQTEATPSRELIRSAFRNEGIFGIYRGFWSTAALDCAVIGLSIPIWECFKFIYSGSVGRPLNSSEAFTCGIAGGEDYLKTLIPKEAEATIVKMAGIGVYITMHASISVSLARTAIRILSLSYLKSPILCRL